MNDGPQTKRLTDSHLSAATWRQRFAIRIEGAGHVFQFAWFVWLTAMVAVGGLLVGLFLRDIAYIVVSLGAGFSAFLVWTVFSQLEE